jgi:hypothetical protein
MIAPGVDVFRVNEHLLRTVLNAVAALFAALDDDVNLALRYTCPIQIHGFARNTVSRRH